MAGHRAGQPLRSAAGRNGEPAAAAVAVGPFYTRSCLAHRTAPQICSEPLSQGAQPSYFYASDITGAVGRCRGLLACGGRHLC